MLTVKKTYRQLHQRKKKICEYGNIYTDAYMQQYPALHKLHYQACPQTKLTVIATRYIQNV
jgi:hypothetical protein